jgi:predicted nucleic acid-binding protein
MQPSRLVAVDSNILLALAGGNEEVLDAWEIIRSRLRPVLLIVPPTVLGEVGHQAADPSRAKLQALAAKALRELRSCWMLQPVELRADQDSAVEQAAEEICKSGLLPFAERNDAFIMAEAAVLECMLLVSRDSHLHGLNRAELKRLLGRFNLAPPLIASPREIFEKFYR